MPIPHCTTDWRQSLLGSIERLEVDADWQGVRGTDNAIILEDLVCQLLRQPDLAASFSEHDIVAIRSAALLRGAQQNYRAGGPRLDRLPFSTLGIDALEALLYGLGVYEPHQIRNILTYKQKCDGLSDRFPVYQENESPRIVAGQKVIVSGNSVPEASDVLVEADACGWVTEDALERSVRGWLAAGVPWFGSSGALLPTPVWHESVAGNLRLMSKIAILAAWSDLGRRLAFEGYDRAEDIIRQQCERAGLSYVSEIDPATAQHSSSARLRGKTFNLQIVGYQNIRVVTDLMRELPLRGDAMTRPYHSASIQSTIMGLDDLSPIATYVLTDRLDATQELHDALMICFGVGLFDLAGRLTFRYNSDEEDAITSPVVESYIEPHKGTPQQINAVVDGLHRCMVARKLGISHVRVIHVEHVPYPLIALPTLWNRVAEYSKTPQEDNKRIYRFAGADKYFYYRDLEILGSRGHRKEHEFANRLAH